jgi:hypothetical protein
MNDPFFLPPPSTGTADIVGIVMDLWALVAGAGLLFTHNVARYASFLASTRIFVLFSSARFAAWPQGLLPYLALTHGTYMLFTLWWDRWEYGGGVHE